MTTRIRLAAILVSLLALMVLTSGAEARPATPDARLLAMYEPVAQFDPQERFLPTKVQSFITDSALEALTGQGSWVVVNPDPGPGDLPAPGTGVWRLDEGPCTPAAPLGGLECYAAAGDTGSGGPAVYGRVAHQDGYVVLQYWYFYYDDVYSYAYPASDFIWQAHEGDWEVVNVVLSGEEEPLFVGYSQHCLGAQRPWATTPRLDDTHPVVNVAFGSHANYFSAGTHPLNVACIPAPALLILQQSGLPLPVDYAFPGPTAGPQGSGGLLMPIHQIGDDGPAWMQFPGFWGELQYFHAPSPIGTVAFGTAPVGPAFHAVWMDPLGTLATWPAG